MKTKISRPRRVSLGLIIILIAIVGLGLFAPKVFASESSNEVNIVN